MKAAYVDSSVLVAISLGETDHEDLTSRLEKFDQLFSSNLLEAELRSAPEAGGFRRNRRWSSHLDLVGLPKPTADSRVQVGPQGGLLEGADLWHLACALYLREELEEISFLSLDDKQVAVAGSLGFDLG